MCHLRFPSEQHLRALTPKLDEQPSGALRGFEAQPSKPSWVAYSIRVPHALDTCPIQSMSASTTRLALSHPHAGACPKCQSPWPVTWLLWSLDQDPALVLRRSHPISLNPHNLHLRCRPPSLYCTPAHHKPRDLVAQNTILYSC
jgi:hypothetical protein